MSALTDSNRADLRTMPQPDPIAERYEAIRAAAPFDEDDRPRAGTACAQCRHRGHFCPARGMCGDVPLCGACGLGEWCAQAAAVERVRLDLDPVDPELMPAPCRTVALPKQNTAAVSLVQAHNAFWSVFTGRAVAAAPVDQPEPESEGVEKALRADEGPGEEPGPKVSTPADIRAAIDSDFERVLTEAAEVRTAAVGVGLSFAPDPPKWRTVLRAATEEEHEINQLWASLSASDRITLLDWVARMGGVDG